MPLDDFTTKRVVTESREIKDINPEEDIRVSVIGTLVDKSEDRLMVDDGTGQIEVSFNEDLSKFKTGSLVRIVGKVNLEGGMRGEIIQDFSKLDVKLYKKAKKLFDSVVK